MGMRICIFQNTVQCKCADGSNSHKNPVILSYIIHITRK